MPGLEAAQALEAIIGRAVEREHIEPILQKRDERQEMFAIEAVLVEILGWPVRCRDYRDAVADDPGKQPGQDHGVSRIGDDHQIGRASCRERVCPDVSDSGVAGYLTNKHNTNST